MDYHQTQVEDSRPAEGQRQLQRSHRWPWRLALAVGTALVAWEYTLQFIFYPSVKWSWSGVFAHAAFDVLIAFPLVLTAMALGRRYAARLKTPALPLLDGLSLVALTALVFIAISLPFMAARDLVHDELGNRLGISMAIYETTVIDSSETFRESTELCSFRAVGSPRTEFWEQPLSWIVEDRLITSGTVLAYQLAALVPLLLLLSSWKSRHLWARALRATRFSSLRLLPLRLDNWKLGLSAAVAMFLLFCVGRIAPEIGRANAMDTAGTSNPHACTDGSPVKEYDVSAINITMTLNRYGDHVTNAYMYALDANIPAIRQFENSLEAGREAMALADDPNLPSVGRVSHGLRKDVIQPLVIRANLGECLRVNFTNQVETGIPVSMHILGLPHTAQNAGSAVGANPNTFAEPGQTVTYEIPLPRTLDAERAYYFHHHGAGRQEQNMGLFGAIVAEPPGSTYLDVETGMPLDTITGSNWEAIIVDPNLDDRADAKSFREFVVFYHEIGDEGFTDIRDYADKKIPLIDDVGGVYRPAARALNYRSEPFRRRLEIEKKFKSLGYASYPFGDPATPMPRSYLGEGVKTRLMHGGSEVFHVHHLHGGGDRWRRNPNADPSNDFWKGLTKVPDPNLTSIHLDSQSIGPGTSYNLEHECGAGGCQQGVGDFLFHCHIGHHYISGMWSFWRVYGTTQTAETNLAGRPLAMVPELFQNPNNPLIPPAPPEDAVSAGNLIGLVVDDGRMIVADNDLTDQASQIGVLDYITRQLPPAGERLDKFDATVWNWISQGDGAGLRVYGEPESNEPFSGYESSTPGERPEVTFNPKNGRYTYPLFRPQKGKRPPFSARHSGAPWLGEEMKEGRLDGLCARNGVSSNVEIGNAKNRYYPISAITLPVPVTSDRFDPDGMIFVLNEQEVEIRGGSRAIEPLTIRSNVGDCVEILLTNKIPDGPLNKEHSKINMHSHFVQFDTQASDGVITGMSYEQSVRPIESEERWLTGGASLGATTIAVNQTDRLRPGVWIGIGLGEGTCGADANGQPLPCTEVRQISSMTATSISFDEPLANNHGVNQAVGVEFVRYRWYSDVDFGTVFYHTHVEFKDWDHGLFGTHVVEPKGSTYHDPTTGHEVRSGTLVDIRVDPSAGGNPVAHGVEGSFREFMLFLQNNNPVERPFVLGGGTINLRAEPWRLRQGDAAYRLSSVTHGDPWTQAVRAYVGDPVVIRGMGLVERVGGIRFTGHRFNMERYTDKSDIRDTTFLGISERFDVSLEGGAGGPAGYPGDFLYYSTLGRDFESGAWGLLRVHDAPQSNLQPLPDRPAPDGTQNFPTLTHTGEAPPALRDGPGNVCPAEAPVRNYSVVISDTEIVYNDRTAPDTTGVAYHLNGRQSASIRTPLVLRANAGDCLRVRLRNNRTDRSSLSIGQVLFDPQRSYGSAIGYNYDSTAIPGWGKTFEYFADKELGIVIGLNLADLDSIERGAFAGLVVEPKGSEYRRPGSNEPLPAGGVGVQADIVAVDGTVTREFVALFSDQDRRIGQNAMPYPNDIENHNGINYSAEPLRLRGVAESKNDVFRSDLHGDPRHVVTVPAGQPLVYRVALPWGNQVHVPTLEGHRWPLEPGMEGSEQVFNQALAPGMGLNLEIVGGAGGDIAAPGDYLFLDRRQPFLEGGLWNLLRVTDDGSSGATDQVHVDASEISGENESAGRLQLAGWVSVRPAGDTANVLKVFSGSRDNGHCTGTLLGSTVVDPGNGRWIFDHQLPRIPEMLCFESSGGGLLDGHLEP